MSLDKVFESIQVVKDFPKPGIVFRHIGPLLKNTPLFRYAMGQLMSTFSEKFDIVCGLESRGFQLATAIQFLTETPQVMIRKAGKLPTETFTVEYNKEYGSDKLELEKSTIQSGQRVLIVDDLMATGGSLLAAIDLVQQAGGIVVGVITLIEFTDLGGRERITGTFPSVKVHSLFGLKSTDEMDKLDANVTIPFMPKPFRPTVYPCKDELPVLTWHPSMESFAQKLLAVSSLRPSYINWDYFPDTWPNITFEPSDTLINKDLVFIMSVSKKEIFAEQLALLVALPRQLIHSLTIVIPYLGPATHERVNYSGQLATVEPILKILSSCIPMTKTGPPIVRIYDIHALQIRFYPSDNITMKLTSAIPVLSNYLKTKKERYAIAYPDDGSYKRFNMFFKESPQVICSKIRDGDERKIIIRDRINWPEINQPTHVIIIDDLVQSGETLLSCAKALQSYQFNKISAYVTHAVFPNNAWRKFTTSNVISEFIITDTNPEVSDVLFGIKPFVVLSIQSHLCQELQKNTPGIYQTDKPIGNVYVASTNVAKLTAVFEAILNGARLFNRSSRVYLVDGITSGVPEQPFGMVQIEQGVTNRLEQCMKCVNDPDAIYIAIENGIDMDEDGKYYDVACIKTSKSNTITYSRKVIIPTEYNEMVKESLKTQTVTFGSILQSKVGTSDWHYFVSGESRKNLIRDAVIRAL